MRVGVLKEIKNREYRVALTPEGAETLVNGGHRVLVERGAGEGSGFDNDAYEKAGASLVDAAQAWEADLVLKVKEPQPEEYPHLARQMLFTYFHLAGVPVSLTEALLAAGTTAIAYETVTREQPDREGARLPLLAPMSAVAGNMAVTVGSYYLARFNGGKGMQLGRVMGHRYGKVVVVGDGVVGRHAARVANAMGAEVAIFSRRPEREVALKQDIGADLKFVLSGPDNFTRELLDADLLVGAVLLPGARAPHLITEEMVAGMQPGSVLVDVSIDQGGCIATARPTSHSDPVYLEHGVIHYCVTNMPGAYPATSTLALTRATQPYVLRLAEKGLAALHKDVGFAQGVNTFDGWITDRAVAESLGLLDRYRPFAIQGQQ